MVVFSLRSCFWFVTFTGTIAPPFLLTLVAIFVWILALAQLDDVPNLDPSYKGTDWLGSFSIWGKSHSWEQQQSSQTLSKMLNVASHSRSE